MRPCHLERTPRRLLERVPTLLEGVVCLRRQADVGLAAGQSFLEVGHVETYRYVVAGSLLSEIDPAPGRVPGRPELEPGEVIEEIAVHRATPIEDRADALIRDQDIEIEQVAMDEMPLLHTI